MNLLNFFKKTPVQPNPDIERFEAVAKQIELRGAELVNIEMCAYVIYELYYRNSNKIVGELPQAKALRLPVSLNETY